MRTEPKEAEDGKIWVSGWGNTEAKVMIITSHPSVEDLRAGYILSQDDENYGPIDEVKNALKASGLKEEDCWFTSVVKFGIGNKDKPNSKQIEECSAELDEEIESIKPKLIITLGAEAFKRVMRQNISQSNYIGEIIDCSPISQTDGSYKTKVLANYSPANIYRVDPKLRPEFMENFDLAKRFINGNLKYKDFEYLLVKDPEVNKMILQHYMDNDMWSIGYDAEWKGKFMKDEQIYTFQYSCEPDKAIILQIMQDDGTMNIPLLKTMEAILSHPKADRLGWNIRADDKRLKLQGLNIPDENLGFDGMKAVAFFDSRWRKGLETGIKRFTNYRPYYNELYKKLREHKRDAGAMCDMMQLEPETWWTYCAGDAVSHREACLNMRKEMKSRLPKAVSKYYFDVYLPLSHYLTDMELTGLPIDKVCIDTITKQYNECYDLLYTRLMDATKRFGFDTAAYDASVAEIGEEATLEKGLRPDFNPRSAAQKKYFFFERLKLKPAYYVKKGKAKPRAWYENQTPQVQKQYQPSANGKSIASIRFELVELLKKDPDDEELQMRFQIVRDYLDLARVSVFSHKFLSKVGVEENTSTQGLDEGEGLTVGDDEGDEPLKASYWGAICNDGKIHADFYECLDNFRSSSKVNVQNPASKVLSHIPGIFSQFNLEVPKNIRNIFYTGDKDYHFAEVDVAGADLAIAAFLSKDPDYIKDILKGGFHTTKMREYFKDPNLSKEEASKYVTSKSITFRVAYTAGLMSAALPIQAEIYAENGDFVDIEVIKYALRTWERYRTYMEYREDCQNQVKNDQMIVNARGIKYHFEYSDDFAIQAGWMNQALAYPIASELALFMWDISVKIKDFLKKAGVWMKYCYPCNVVHDANYWLVHKDLMKDNFFPEVCKHIFTKEVKIATGDNLGMEMVVADRWKGKEKVFAKETKWNFETKSWEWEK